MGTLGCINDMLKRDKENRDLRKIGRERMKETRNRLLRLQHTSDNIPNIRPEELDKIERQNREKEEQDRKYFLKTKLLFIGTTLIAILLLWSILTLFL